RCVRARRARGQLHRLPHPARVRGRVERRERSERERRLVTDLERLAADVDVRLRDADAELSRWATFGWSGRQPVHTVYVPADRTHAGIVAEWSERARTKLDLHAPYRSAFADALDVDYDLVAYDRVV